MKYFRFKHVKGVKNIRDIFNLIKYMDSKAKIT